MSLIYLFFLQVLAGILATMAFEFVLKGNKKLRHRYYKHHQLFWGWHIHHSMYGVLSILWSLIIFLADKRELDMFWLAFGMGIIIQHTISDGRLVFIEKQKAK